VRFDDRVTGKLATFAPHARVVHIDIDPANVGKNRAPEISLVADAREALTALQTAIKNLGQLYIDRGIKRRAVWWKRIRAWQLEQPLRFSGSGDQIKPQTVIRELHRLTNGDALIVTDVGQHQMWAAQFYPFKRSRQWITSGGLGAMGYGVPAAIGARLALGDQMVVAVVGDGGFQMTNQELAMAVQYDLPIKVLIMNNGYLGMVRQWQEMFYERAYSEVDLSASPDFVKLAEAYGAFGVRATRPDELSDVLSAGLSHKGVAVMDIVVSKEENVFPIVPAGGNSRDMIVE
jgi:acetolactate synthase-1/2/3 large subunit